MRVRIEIPLKEPMELPLSYHRALQGAIYSAFSAEPGLAADLHDMQQHSSQRVYKPFCFSQLSGKYRIEKGKIFFFDKVQFIFSTCLPELIESFLDSLRENGIRIGRERYPVFVRRLEEPKIERERITVKMLSPLTVSRTERESGKTIYYGPDREDFYKLICQNYIRKYMQIFGEKPLSPLVIHPLELLQNNKYVTSYKGIYITAWRGRYELQAEPKGLQLLYDIGIGSKNAQGFGLFEIQS